MKKFKKAIDKRISKVYNVYKGYIHYTKRYTNGYNNLKFLRRAYL